MMAPSCDTPLLAPKSHSILHYQTTKPTTDSTTDSITESITAPLKPQSPKQTSYQTLITSLLLLSFLSMTSMTAISPTVLLYMNASSFTAGSIQPYINAFAIFTTIPIFSNLALSHYASTHGPGRAILLNSLLAAAGIFIIILAPTSLFFFYVGYALFATSNSHRVLRVAALSKIVPPEQRTTVLATHALMIPLGGLAGPLIWILAQNYRDSINIAALRIDRFSINYAVAALIFIVMAYISYRTLLGSSIGISTGADTHRHMTFHPATVTTSSGVTRTIDLASYRKKTLVYFCVYMFLISFSAGIYLTAFQPILVDIFHSSDASLGIIFEIIALFAIIPPLLVAVLSKYLTDRQIMAIGITGKLIGMCFYLPLFGPPKEWQVILGFLLIIKASMFFITASVSLFSKLLGGMTTSSSIGILMSAQTAGQAAAQVLLGSVIVKWFGGWNVVWFALPAVAGAIFIASGWKGMDPNEEGIRAVTEEVRRQIQTLEDQDQL